MIALALALALTLGMAAPAGAASPGEETGSEVLAGLLSSFDAPLGDLTRKPYPSEWRNLLAGFSGRITFDYPLADKPIAGSGSQGARTTGSPTFALTVAYNPLAYWFGQVTLYKYLDESRQAPWNGDFTYVFGYDDWHPNTVSLVYANYGGNRFAPDASRDERVTRFDEGTISLGYKWVLPKWMERWFTVHDTGGVGLRASYHLTPRYVDDRCVCRRDAKHALSLGLRYVIHTWWYAEITLYGYPVPSQKQPWDPDFTYTLGYFDWHPGTFALQYSNYSGNRYPWNASSRDTGRVKDGSLSLSWSWAW